MVKVGMKFLLVIRFRYTLETNHIGGSGRDEGRLAQNFFIFIEFWGKMANKGWRPSGVGAPPLGNPGSATEFIIT